MTNLRSLVLLACLCLQPHTVFAHGYAEKPLTAYDVAQAIEIAKETFREHKGTWLLDRTTRITTKLNEDGDQVEVRIYYKWGSEKLYRFFCDYDELERLHCDVAFSGPGAL